MYVDDLLEMLTQPANDGRRKLVENINKFREVLPRFKDLILDRKIISFVETHMTQKLKKVGHALMPALSYSQP